MITAIRKLLVPVFMLLSAQAFSQNVEMAETMRSEGKIYVVVAVAAIVILVLGIYMISIDRKVSRLEKESRSKQ